MKQVATATLFTLVVCVAITFVQARDKEVATSNVATSKEREEQLKEKMQAANPRMNFRSMEDIRKEMNAQHAEELNVVQKVHMHPQDWEDLQTQMNNEAKTAMVGELNEVNPVLVDTEAISQHAKMAVERARNFPSSFKEWEKRMKQKMAAARTNSFPQAVANENDVHNYNGTRVATSIRKHESPSRKDLEIEIVVDAAANSPFKDGSKIAEQEKMTSSHPRTYPLPARKVWEDMVQARIEELKANPQKWEEMKKHVEKMEMPYRYTRPYKPHRPYHTARF